MSCIAQVLPQLPQVMASEQVASTIAAEQAQDKQAAQAALTQAQVGLSLEACIWLCHHLHCFSCPGKCRGAGEYYMTGTAHIHRPLQSGRHMPWYPFKASGNALAAAHFMVDGGQLPPPPPLPPPSPFATPNPASCFADMLSAQHLEQAKSQLCRLRSASPAQILHAQATHLDDALMHCQFIEFPLGPPPPPLATLASPLSSTTSSADLCCQQLFRTAGLMTSMHQQATMHPRCAAAVAENGQEIVLGDAAH